jgi:ABC-type cobalamin/Fe3+-siderophores transport system ATPase subunit
MYNLFYYLQTFSENICVRELNYLHGSIHLANKSYKTKDKKISCKSFILLPQLNNTSSVYKTEPNNPLSNMGNPILLAKNLTKSYNEKEVLKGIDLEIDKGQIIGYIGPNGAGKFSGRCIGIGIRYQKKPT